MKAPEIKKGMTDLEILWAVRAAAWVQKKKNNKRRYLRRYKRIQEQMKQVEAMHSLKGTSQKRRLVL